MAAKTRNGVRPAVGRREVIVMTISIYNKGCSRRLQVDLDACVDFHAIVLDLHGAVLLALVVA